MRLIRAEFKKTLIEAISYYPDYIVGLITDLILLIIIINIDGNMGEKVFGYILWILVNGVLSEASMCISTEKQLGTLQNLLIKPYSISKIITVKTIVWFVINFVKALVTAIIASIFMNTNNLFKIEYLYVIILVCIGIMGLSYILSALTLVFTKVASFVSVIGYLFLFLSGSIIDIPNYLYFTNPLSAGVEYTKNIINGSNTLYDFFVLLFISILWFCIGKVIFIFIFNRSKQFKWTY